MIRDEHSGSGSWFFTHPWSRGQKGTGYRIRIRNTGRKRHFFCFFDCMEYSANYFLHIRYVLSAIYATFSLSWYRQRKKSADSILRPAAYAASSLVMLYGSACDPILCRLTYMQRWTSERQRLHWRLAAIKSPAEYRAAYSPADGQTTDWKVLYAFTSIVPSVYCI